MTSTKRVVIGLLILGIWPLVYRASAQTAPSPTPAPSVSGARPFVNRITPSAAPSGAVVQISIQTDVSDPKTLADRFRLAIGGVTAQFYPTYRNDRNTIAAIVPTRVTPSRAPDGKTIPVEVVFYNIVTGEGGFVYDDFSVLVPTGLKGKAVEISGVTQVTDDYYDVTFNDDIPTELWPKTTIYFDGRKVDQILKMEERSFIVGLPGGVNRFSFNVFAKVGDKETSTFKYENDPVPTVSPGFSTEPVAEALLESPKWPVYLLAVIVIGVISWLLARRFFRMRSASPSFEAPRDIAEELHLPEELPEALVDACIKGECVLYAGAGLAAQSGLPTWKQFIHQLLKWAQENKYITETDAAAYSIEVVRGQADSVADSVVSRLTTEQQQSALNSYLQEVFLKRVSPSPFHAQVRQIKFSAILTANFDNLLETVYDVKSEDVYTPQDTEKLLAALTRRAFFILKLYGQLDKKETVIVAPAQYEDAITDNTLFSQFMQTLFFSRTLFFIGASLDGIEAYLKGISLPKEVGRIHYAIVAVTGGAWRSQAEVLERRYGIKVLPYTPSNNYAELKTFLERLTEAVASGQARTVETTQKISRLKRVSLQNIGPFETLDLDLGLDARWHIFLGDNGVGKSTVLKAIALALCGKEAQPYAGRLLRDTRRGKDEPPQEMVGTITLETDKGTSYVTTLRRYRNGEVELSSTTARPLEAEGWLGMGFPPLRTTSWEAPKGPEADIKRKSRPVINDLLPLVTGDVDPRLDKLKQWIVNLDYEDRKNPAVEGRYTRLIQKMFDLIGKVAEGMTLTYKGVAEGNRIVVETDEGTLVPLEGLSQGTISLIGWIGIFMQRLSEVFPEDEDPTQRYALVLMDEIDAHMHPLWQRTLVSHLKESFPAAQFIATTHSPLVVGGMPAQQVVRFANDKQGKAGVVPIAPDMTLGYTDQVLTSLLFGLPTSLDRDTEKKKQRYYELYRLKDRGGNEEEYENLKQELMARVPPPSGSYNEKHAKQLEEANSLAALGTKLSKRSPEEGQVLLDRAKKLLEMLGESNNDKN